MTPAFLPVISAAVVRAVFRNRPLARWPGRNEDGWGQPSVPAESRTRSRREKSDTCYRAKTWDARVQLNNALDEDYILAAGSRTSLVVGDARSLKGSITYRF